MKVAVIGSTGGTGRKVIEQALERGHDVIALARRPEAIAMKHERLEARRADVRDLASLERALAGVDVVVSTFGAARSSLFGKVTVYSEGGDNLVAAMKKLGIGRLVVVTSGGVEDDDPSFEWFYARVLRPLLLKRAYDDMKRLESIVRRSGLEWTLVRPPQLTDAALTGTYRVSPRFAPEGGVQLSRADLAHFLLEEAEHSQWVRGTPTLAY